MSMGNTSVDREARGICMMCHMGKESWSRGGEEGVQRVAFFYLIIHGRALSHTAVPWASTDAVCHIRLLVYAFISSQLLMRNQCNTLG